MRWFHVAIICLFVAIVAIFAAQNLEIVTVSFLRFSIRVPLAFLAAGIYVLGTLTGGSLMALLRQSMHGARRRAVAAP